MRMRRRQQVQTRMDQIAVLTGSLCCFIHQLVSEHRADAYRAKPIREHAVLVRREHQYARTADYSGQKPKVDHDSKTYSSRSDHLRRPLQRHHRRPEVKPRRRHQQLQMATAAQILQQLRPTHRKQ